MTKILNRCSSQLKTTAPRRQFNLKFFNFGLGALIMVFGVFYLVNISDLTVKGFALRNLKTQAASLADEQLANQEKVNALQSYYSLSNRTQKLNMVAIDNIEYLAVNSPLVAKK